MNNILVTGSNGQLGLEIQELVHTFPERFEGFKFYFTDRTTLDLANTVSIKDFFDNHEIDFCINCAAYTAVDKAEEEKDLCKQINTTAVAELASECEKQEAVLIHISSDYVFDGAKNSPYLTTDKPNPINYYGQTKLDGENLALKNNPNTVVIRTSWVYSKTYGKNFYKTILRLASEKEELKIVSDQIGCPTDAKDLADYIFKILNKVNSKKTIPQYGIYNYSGVEIMSWFEFAKKIVLENSLNCRIIPIPTSQYPTPAKRPMYSVLDMTQ